MTIFVPTPHNCDICGNPLLGKMYDAKTKQGPWACMCPHCFKQHGVGRLGTGYGQEYKRREDGYFEKVAG